MSNQQMRSDTRGVGQLLHERRYFAVPQHQRDYSWPIGAVEEYFDDIVEAMNRGDSDYFLGLIVLVDTDAPNSKRFEILDGQQRLATATMIYAAIRHWLKVNGFDNDATKIQNDFIGISEIGEVNVEPRIILNNNNQAIFQEVVVNQCDDTLLEKRLTEAGRHSSTRKLVEAAVKCRKYAAELAESQGADKARQAKILFDLAKYLRDHVQVNCLDVTSPENAYTIFESLNDRGVDLSVLDLLKNHVFREAGTFNERQVQEYWTKMLANLGDRKADLFLKAFWTSRYGRVQRGRLFHELKAKFPERKEAIALASELSKQAEVYANLEIADTDPWKQHSEATQDAIKALALLGGTQTHAIILAALQKFSPHFVERLLKHLVTLIIRYQLIGRGRTGRLEITASKVAEEIFNEKLKTPKSVWDELKSIIPPDDEFIQDFSKYSETKAPRARYILRELELQRWRQLNPQSAPQFAPISDPEKVNLEHILPKHPGADWQPVTSADPWIVDECVDRLGNLCLLDKSSNKKEGAKGFSSKASAVYTRSEFLLTKTLAATYSNWDRSAIEDRQKDLASLAVSTWPL